MSFGWLPSKKKGNQNRTLNSSSTSCSQSGGSSLVVLSHSANATFPQILTMGSTNEPTQATARSFSLSHATSHVRMTKPPSPKLVQITPQPTKCSQGGQERATPEISQAMAGPSRQEEEMHRTISLNTPKRSPAAATLEISASQPEPADYWLQGTQDAYDKEEEHEVGLMTSPEREEGYDSLLRQTEYSTAMDSGRPRKQQPFITARRNIPSVMGAQFVSPFRTAGMTTARMDILMDGISELKEQMRTHAKDTEQIIERYAQHTASSIDRLIATMGQNRLSRSSSSRSSRSSSPRLKYFLSSHPQQPTIEEEIEEEERVQTPEPARDAPAGPEEMPTDKRS